MIVSTTISDSREAEIADAIKSVIAHVDLVLLVDTGITDATIERAREIAGPRLVVRKHKWVDFSTARNAGIAAAEDLGATWIVIVDSDERIDFGEVDLRAALRTARADALFVRSSDGHYLKEKFVRAGANARFFGPTHEALISGSKAPLHGVVFHELPKTQDQLKQKFSRDAAILTEFTGAHPKDPRWWYYLGASYEGLCDYARAAEAFGKCVELRKTGDEAAWSAYKQAEQLFIAGRYDEAVTAAARGLGANATYAECAWIASVARARVAKGIPGEQNNQAIAWARITEAIGRYKGCGVERAFFQHLPAHYELPYDVLRFSLPPGPEREQANEDFHAAKLARLGAANDSDIERMAVSRSTSRSIREEVRSMLPGIRLHEMCPSAIDTEIRFKPPDGRHPMNPSICWHRGDLWCVVRAVNYSMSGRKYTIEDPDGVVRTDNYLGRLRLDGELVEPRLMHDLDTSPRQESRIVGYEDIRLVSIDGSDGPVLSGSATVCDRDASRRMIARLELSEEGDVVSAIVQPSNQLHEKNWMPLSVKGALTWIYSLDPTAVLPGPLRSCPLALDHLRGGAAIPLNGGYLCVTHENLETDDGRVYLHRFVHLDAKFNVTRVSPTWVFAHHGIEFCSGIARAGKHLLLAYGIEDREAWITRVPLKEVEAMRWITP